jgi:hypothetical protein
MKKKKITFLCFLILLFVLHGLVPVYAQSVIYGQVVGQIPIVTRAGNVSLASIRYTESVPGNFETGNEISVTLPEGITFQTGLASSSYFEATGDLMIEHSFSDGDRVITYSVTRTSLLNEAALFIKLPVIISDPVPQSGDIVVEVETNTAAILGGSFFTEKDAGTVIISLIPDTLSSLPRGVSGAQQVDGALRLVESRAGVIQPEEDNRIHIKLPSGVTWADSGYTVSATPSLPPGVTVTAFRNNTNHGELKLVLSGGKTTTATTFSIAYPTVLVSAQALFGGIRALVEGRNKNSHINGSTFLANVVDNNQGSHLFPSVFTIGSLIYVRDGVPVKIDVAPVIRNNRVLLPLRSAAQACGVRPGEIFWDNDTKAVSLSRGGRIAQVTVGSTMMLTEGSPVIMDVAPEIIDGRVLLPVRWLGSVLQADIFWNSTGNSVTVTPY